MSDEPTANTKADPMPDTLEMELRERVTLLEDQYETLLNASRGLALLALGVAGGLFLLILIRTRAPA
jgi:hypothetical protein